MASTGAGDIFTKPQTLGSGVVALPFSFAPNGSSAPTAIQGKGIASVAYVTGSMWRITLNSNYAALLGASIVIQNAASAAAQGYKIEVDGTATSPTTGVIQLRSINTGSTATDIAAAAGTVVRGVLFLSTADDNK